MICWGAPVGSTLQPPAVPSSWDTTNPDNYVDCWAYGGYSGPTKTGMTETTAGAAGNGTMSLTRSGTSITLVLPHADQRRRRHGDLRDLLAHDHHAPGQYPWLQRCVRRGGRTCDGHDPVLLRPGDRPSGVCEVRSRSREGRRERPNAAQVLQAGGQEVCSEFDLWPLRGCDVLPHHSEGGAEVQREEEYYRLQGSEGRHCLRR
jgi:hypothetical protein